MRRIKLLTAALLLFAAAYSATAAVAVADSLSWPREVEVNKIPVTFYEPQLESYENNVLQGRMAVSYLSENKDMRFGALWFKATLSTDLDNRVVTLVTLEIPKVSFADSSAEAKLGQFKKALIQQVKAANFEMSLDRLVANLKEVGRQNGINDENIQNLPPQVFYRKVPSILVSIDGTPSFKADDSKKLEYVQNTPFFIAREKNGKTCYLNAGDWWYSSASVTEGWQSSTKVPKSIKKLALSMTVQQGGSAASTQNNAKDTVQVATAPEVIVSTVPAELIVTNGDPQYAPIDQTNLLYIKNTESNVIMDINSQEHYILLSGRWYRSNSLDKAQWTFCKPSNLPADFAKIPSTSDMKNVLANVPGTSEAQEALLEQSIPQTATVNRKEATVSVTYNGAPKFESITGTPITYAVNTSNTVLFAEGKYYCVDNGIWFVSNAATGPWTVADKRPAGVENIPSESPVNNVKYVYIYDSTPEVVYVGYLPGYMNSYIYDGVVVYGTGFYYNPWYGPYYYPRPCTWGFGVYYNPWYGWGFGFGFGFGYNHGYYNGYNRGYMRGYNRGYMNGYARGYEAGHRNAYRGRHGVTTRTTINNNRTNNININTKNHSVTRANNVVADKSGRVFQQDKSGKWSDVSKGVTTNNRSAVENKASEVDRSRLNNTMESRARGSRNYGEFRQNRPSFSGGGGGRGRR